MNLLTCFNIDLYRDALCKIGNGMHNDRWQCEQKLKLPLYCRLLLAYKDTNSRSRWGLFF